MSPSAGQDLIAAKRELRRHHLRLRDELDAEQRIVKSLDAATHGLDLEALAPPLLEPGTVMAGFHPIRSEIDPRPLMFELARRGARLALPVVIDKTTIHFRELVRGAPLIETGFGTVGPDEDAAVLTPQIILVPLSVFDRNGGRIGYGGGFYDRAIERLEKSDLRPLLLGMAFCVQEAQTVPREPHDRLLDGIITEAGYFPAAT